MQLKTYDVPVIGGKDCAKVTKTPSHGETFTIGDGIKVKALHTPCHTQDSICFLFEDGNDRAVFTGDTLFIGGTSMLTFRAPADTDVALRLRAFLRRNTPGDGQGVERDPCESSRRHQSLRISHYFPNCVRGHAY